jgi:mono/diheme cytochrome c family protein
MKLLSAMAFFSLCVLACSPSPPPDITDPGQLIYLGYADKNVQCSRCHGPEGQGGMFGPKLHGSVRKLGADSARHVIRFGRGVGDKRMEGFEGKLSPLQIEHVMAFIAAWSDSLRDTTSANDSN